MPDLKKISKEAIPRAVQKAERYRLLNQSWATESICLDILEVDPTNQPVLVMLILAITDQFGRESGELVRRARETLERLTDGVVREGRAAPAAGKRRRDPAMEHVSADAREDAAAGSRG